MRTPPDLQATVTAEAVEIQDRRLILQAQLCLELSLPEQDADLPRRLEAGIEHGGQVLKRRLFQQAVERKDKVIVGVNEYVQEDEAPIEILYIDESASQRQLEKVDRMKRSRDGARVAAGNRTNTMPPILEAVRAYATLGEMCDALRDVWGEYEEVPVI